MWVRRLSRTGVRTSSSSRYRESSIPEIEAYHCALITLRMNLQRCAYVIPAKAGRRPGSWKRLKCSTDTDGIYLGHLPAIHWMGIRDMWTGYKGSNSTRWRGPRIRRRLCPIRSNPVRVYSLEHFTAPLHFSFFAASLDQGRVSAGYSQAIERSLRR